MLAKTFFIQATFSVSLISRADTVNLSNMPVISEEEYTSKGLSGADSAIAYLTEWFSSLTTQDQKSKWKITHFDKTPLMSTYLVAFANGDFKHLESSYTSPLSGKTRPLRIYSKFSVGLMKQLLLIQLSYRGRDSPGPICAGCQSQGVANIREDLRYRIPFAEAGHSRCKLTFDSCVTKTSDDLEQAHDFDAGKCSCLPHR